MLDQQSFYALIDDLELYSARVVSFLEACPIVSTINRLFSMYMIFTDNVTNHRICIIINKIGSFLANEICWYHTYILLKTASFVMIFDRCDRGGYLCV